MPIDTTAVEAALADRLGERSLRHSEAVAESAAQLAETYGVDVDAARLAGLVHDWDRELDAEALFTAAAQADLPVTETDRIAPYLLHARTAAADLATRFPELPADVIDAVARHTLGAAAMTPLDMVVFVADMIEPHRTWPGVDGLRALVGTVSLRALFIEAYRRSFVHLIDAGKPVHPETVAVWNALLGEVDL